MKCYPEEEPHIHLISDKVQNLYNLRPCPFCGGKKIVMMGAYNVSELVYQCRCAKCHFGGMWQRAPELAGIDWNMREWWRLKRKNAAFERMVDPLDTKRDGIKPCPKCQSKRLLHVTSTELVSRVECADCGTGGMWTASKKRAIANWNERNWWRK